jgi:hypothetical protein
MAPESISMPAPQPAPAPIPGRRRAWWKIALGAVIGLPLMLVVLVLGKSLVDSTLKRSEKRIKSIEMSDRVQRIKKFPWRRPDADALIAKSQTIKPGARLEEVMATMGAADRAHVTGSDFLAMYIDDGFVVVYELLRPRRDVACGGREIMFFFTPGGRLEKSLIADDVECRENLRARGVTK